MDGITCVICGWKSNDDNPAGWLIRPKTYGEPGEMFVVCDQCLNLGSATFDVADGAPFRRLEREVRRENDHNKRVWNSG